MGDIEHSKVENAFEYLLDMVVKAKGWGDEELDTLHDAALEGIRLRHQLAGAVDLLRLARPVVMRAGQNEPGGLLDELAGDIDGFLDRRGGQ
jgi:hypothetical protein